MNRGIARDLLQPALIFAVVLGIYATAVFYLCRFMSKKDIIRFRYTVLRRLNGQSFVLPGLLPLWIHVFRYGVIFPVVAYGWFGTPTVMVAFMYNTKEPAQLILISMSVVTAVWGTAYFSQDPSKDTARVLPFTLLGLFIANFGSSRSELPQGCSGKFLPSGKACVPLGIHRGPGAYSRGGVANTNNCRSRLARTVRRARYEPWWKVWQLSGILSLPANGTSDRRLLLKFSRIRWRGFS